MSKKREKKRGNRNKTNHACYHRGDHRDHHGHDRVSFPCVSSHHGNEHDREKYFLLLQQHHDGHGNDRVSFLCVSSRHGHGNDRVPSSSSRHGSGNDHEQPCEHWKTQTNQSN